MTTVFPFLDSDTQILIIRHSALNGNSYDLENLVNDTLDLERHTHGRKIIPCLEGDLLQLKETGDVVLTHRSFLPLSSKDYIDLKNQKIAVPLEEALERVAMYLSQRNAIPIVLCLELKPITSTPTIKKALSLLQKYHLENSVYIDSFYGTKIDVFHKLNTQIPTSLHLIGNVHGYEFMMDRATTGQSIITVPYRASFGSPAQPVIYGAVESPEIITRVAANPYVHGVYYRPKENKGVRGIVTMLWNSATNTPTLRRVQLLSSHC